MYRRTAVLLGAVLPLALVAGPTAVAGPALAQESHRVLLVPMIGSGTHPLVPESTADGDSWGVGNG